MQITQKHYKSVELAEARLEKEILKRLWRIYTLMSQGVPKGKALREAKLSMMRRKSHPFFWGAFILNGKPE